MLPAMKPADTDGERLARLRLIRSENVGPVNFMRLLARLGDAEAALEALPDIARRNGRRRLRVASVQQAEREVEGLRRIGGRLIMAGDPDYPARLAQAEGAPPVISVLGDAGLLERPTVAVVGARNCSANGRTLCRRIVGELGAQGHVVISGLARGIDAEAHRASLDTGTAAVVAGGVDIFYPPENEALQKEIAERGVVLAEQPLGAEPKARHFPRRNRVISGLSLGVLVVEAALRSGTLITARYAGEQGRDVFAVPGSPLDPRARGANRLIREGARLVESADDILEELASGRTSLFQPVPARFEGPAEDAGFALDPGDEARSALIEALSPEPAEADVLMRASGLGPSDFNALIVELEIAGRVQRHAGNRYALNHDG
ncbi:MAG: DNA protecting protein DprA [Rhizobiales bacterium NRL2]|jgi:DNA processing protein|nr:MAG: DNA protecting protein DprA [Rhizobiales bacterium NRL2]